MNRLNTILAAQTNTCSSILEKGDALRLNRLLDELQPALGSLLPEHKALFLTVLHELDGAGVLYSAAARQHRYAPMSLISVGVEAVASLHHLVFFSESERSTMALCCLLYEYGCMYAESLQSGSSVWSSQKPVSAITIGELMTCRGCWYLQGTTPYAHPHTRFLIEPVLAQVESSDPKLVRYLRTILGDEEHAPYRFASNRGPMSKNPVEPQAAHMRDKVLDAMSRIFLKVHPKPLAPRAPHVPRSAEELKAIRQIAEDFVNGIPLTASPSEREKERRRIIVETEAWLTTDQVEVKTRNPVDKPVSEQADPVPVNTPALCMSSTSIPLAQMAARPSTPSLRRAADVQDGDGCDCGDPGHPGSL